MKLKERLQSDLVVAMKSKDTVSKNVIRAVISAAKYVEIEKSTKLENDEDYLKIIQKEIKLRNDAIEEARKGNREDIIASNQKEINLLNVYLPEQLSEEEIKKILTGIISESGATSQKDMGKLMPLVIQKVSGRAPNALVSKLLREMLQN